MLFYFTYEKLSAIKKNFSYTCRIFLKCKSIYVITEVEKALH